MPIDKDSLKDLYRRINEAFKGDGSFQFTPPETTFLEEDPVIYPKVYSNCPPEDDQGNHGPVWIQGTHTYVPSNRTNGYTYGHPSVTGVPTEFIWSGNSFLSDQQGSYFVLNKDIVEDYLRLQEILCRELEDLGIDEEKVMMILDIHVLNFISLAKLSTPYQDFIKQIAERWEEDIECDGEDS